MSDISCVAESAGPIPQIPFEELQIATNNWDPLAVLGKGGFGTVFKGKIQNFIILIIIDKVLN